MRFNTFVIALLGVGGGKDLEHLCGCTHLYRCGYPDGYQGRGQIDRTRQFNPKKKTHQAGSDQGRSLTIKA